MNACRNIVCQQGYSLDQNTNQCVPLQPVNKPVQPVQPIQNVSNTTNNTNTTNTTNSNCTSGQKYDANTKMCVNLSSLCNSAI